MKTHTKVTAAFISAATVLGVAVMAFAHHPVLESSVDRPCGAESSWTGSFTAHSDQDWNKDWRSRYQIDSGDFSSFSGWTDDQVAYGPFSVGPFSADVDSVTITVKSQWRKKGDDGVDVKEERFIVLTKPETVACPTTTTTEPETTTTVPETTTTVEETTTTTIPETTTTVQETTTTTIPEVTTTTIPEVTTTTVQATTTTVQQTVPPTTTIVSTTVIPTTVPPTTTPGTTVQSTTPPTTIVATTSVVPEIPATGSSSDRLVLIALVLCGIGGTLLVARRRAI